MSSSIDADNQIVALITFDTDVISMRPSRSSIPVPRRRSGRPRAHLVAHLECIRCSQQARTSRVDSGLGEHRSPASDSGSPWWHGRIRAGHVGRFAGLQDLHRGSASAERPRRSCYPGGARGFAPWLRRRVADGQPSDGRGRTVQRCELFDEAGLDAALAKFDQLTRPAPRLENAATKVEERFQACFAARDWAAMGEILADDISADDRRRVVNAGIRHGRDAKVADMRATADLGTTNGTSTVIAIRGQRLAMVRIRLSGRDQRPDAFHTEMLGIAEINADDRMAARVLFDVDDIDAAFEELDTRYLAGEAASHAHAWSAIAQGVRRVQSPRVLRDDGGMGETLTIVAEQLSRPVK